eukprot:3483060-Pleurochrysis_carterae.AAC.3
MSVHVDRYSWCVRCYLTSFRITTPSLAHAATHARSPSRGALGRPPPRVLAPKRDTRARLLVSSRVLNKSHVGSSSGPDGWSSSNHAAYPADLNYIIAKAVATRASVVARHTDASQQLPPATLPAATPSTASATCTTLDSAADPTVAAATPPADRSYRDGTTAVEVSLPETASPRFRRGLGAYPLRNRQPTVLFTARTAREHNPDLRCRGSGCAFTLSAESPDAKTRKQALRDDRVGWMAAERAEITNHEANGSWRMIDRSDVPRDRKLG